MSNGNNKDLNLERFWSRLRPARQVVKVEGWDILKAIEVACTKTNAELAGKLKDLDVSPRVASEIATRAVLAFLDHWYEEIRHGDLVSLIAVILEGRNIPVGELKGFIRALPDTLLERVVQNPGPKASGIQALLAIEHDFRRTGRSAERDYDLHADPLRGGLSVTFRPPRAGGEAVTFNLGDNFEGISSSSGVTST